MTAPSARYRIYTTPKSYSWALRDMLFGKVNKGEDVAAFEARLREYLGAPHVVCVPMARMGIYYALKGLISPGQRVIMSPYTIADVVNVVLSAGGKPVFADIERQTCNIDPCEVERLIDDDTGAVLITHLHGLAAPANDIQQICRRHNVPMLEDTAQAFGAMEHGKKLGTIGEAGIYSFGMYKNLNVWYGGAVVSDNKGLIERIRAEVASCEYQSTGYILKRIKQGLLTDVVTFPAIFKTLTYRIFRFGVLQDVEWINRKVRTELDTSRRDELPDDYRKRFTPLQARMALAQVDHIDTDNETRIRNAGAYTRGLEGIDGLMLPPSRADSSHIFSYYPIQYDDRDSLIRHLMLHRRDVAEQHLKNCADLSGFSEFYRDCPQARQTASKVILLPTYPRYSVIDIERNIEALRAYFQQPNR